jgi:hypothetical protein
MFSPSLLAPPKPMARSRTTAKTHTLSLSRSRKGSYPRGTPHRLHLRQWPKAERRRIFSLTLSQRAFFLLVIYSKKVIKSSFFFGDFQLPELDQNFRKIARFRFDALTLQWVKGSATTCLRTEFLLQVLKQWKPTKTKNLSIKPPLLSRTFMQDFRCTKSTFTI